MENKNQKEQYLSAEDKNSLDRVHLVQLQSYQDIQAVIHLFDKIMIPSLSERIPDLDLYTKKLLQNAFVYIAADTVILGFAAFYANDRKARTAYLSQIAVLPAAQNKGIGRKLLDHCIEVSKNEGMLSLKLEVYKKNDTALRFYRINGFKSCGEASQESIYMIKNLE